MRVIVLSPALPLPFGRADARWLTVLASELSRRGIDVTLVSCTEDSEEAISDAQQLADERGFELVHVPLELREPVVIRKARSLRRPFSEMARSAALRKALELATSGGYDVLHVEHLFSAWATGGMPRTAIYVHHLEVTDWEGRHDLEVRERRLLFQMRRATRTLLERGDRFIVSTPRLAAELAGYRGAVPPVAPVALDPAYYPPTAPCTNPVVGVVGSMHWYPSRSAAERVLQRLWPPIREAVPMARLIVAGWNSERYLNHLFPLPGADLIGTVTHPTEFFERVAVLLYPPPKGSGMKIKVLEALAYGVPVVSNTEGFEGIDLQQEPAVLCADDDQSLITNTVGLLSDSELWWRLRAAGRAFIGREHSPVPAIDRLLLAYEELDLIRT
jgi:glycosyltransferase involved in cell wall biosynthesis